MEIREIIIPAMAILVTNCGLWFVLYHFVISERKQNLAMIEKGIDPSKSKSPKSIKSYLRNGIFGIAIAFSFLFGYFTANLSGMPAYVAYPLMFFLFFGLANFIFYLVGKKTVN